MFPSPSPSLSSLSSLLSQSLKTKKVNSVNSLLPSLFSQNLPFSVVEIPYPQKLDTSVQTAPQAAAQKVQSSGSQKESSGSGGKFSEKPKNVMSFEIYRWNSENGKPPKLQKYDVDVSKCGPMVLDVLGTIKSSLDPSLSYRRSCREGICGSCSMNVQGQNVLACLTPVQTKQYGQGTVRITPLPHMFVVRDLVVDMSNFYKQYRSIEPWLKTRSPPPDGREHLQSKSDRLKLDGRYECILCACCSTACPSYWWNPEKFLGPATLINASRWIMDSRDEFTNERLDSVAGEYKLGRCHTIMNCARTCPKHLNPGKSIAQIRRMLLAKQFTAKPDQAKSLNPSGNVKGS